MRAGGTLIGSCIVRLANPGRSHCRADRVRPHPGAAGNPAAGGHPAGGSPAAGGAQPRARTHRHREGGGTAVDQRGAAARRAAGAGAHHGHHQYAAVDHARTDAGLVHRPGAQDHRRAAGRRRRNLLGAERAARHAGGAAAVRERPSSSGPIPRTSPEDSWQLPSLPRRRRRPPGPASRWCWGRPGRTSGRARPRFATGCATRAAAAPCTCR